MATSKNLEEFGLDLLEKHYLIKSSAIIIKNVDGNSCKEIDTFKWSPKDILLKKAPKLRLMTGYLHTHLTKMVISKYLTKLKK